MIATIVYLIFILIGLIFILKEKNRYIGLAKVFVFSLPFYGLMYDIGISLTIDRIWALIMLFVLFFNKSFLKVGKSLRYFLYFIVYTFTITIVLSQHLPDTVNMFSLLRGKYRYMVQIFFWGLLFTPVFYFVKYIKNVEEIKQLLKILILACVLLSLIGIFQYVFYKRFGYDIIPIGLLQEEKRTGMIYHMYLGNVFRVSSIGGEPKHFAYSLSIVLPLLFFNNYLKVFSIRHSLFCAIIMLFNLFMTLSTQGYILMFLNILVGLILIFHKGIKLRFVIYSEIIVVFFIFLLEINPTTFELVKFRTIERLINPNMQEAPMFTFVEDWNEAVLRFLINHPYWLITGTGLGNIHLYAQEYIPYYAYYMYENVFVAKSGFLRILSETGIIGLLLFIISYIKPLIAVFRFSKRDKFLLIITIFTTYIFFDFLVTQDGQFYIFFSMAILYSIRNIYEREIYKKR